MPQHSHECRQAFQLLSFQPADAAALALSHFNFLIYTGVYVKGEREAGLKLNIQKMKIMASSRITLWQIDGEKVEAVTDFIFLGSKVTMDSDCSHEIKSEGKL